MSHFTDFTYRGSFGASGDGIDPTDGPYSISATGTLTATLTHGEGDAVSGTWTYAGQYLEVGAGGAWSDDGTVADQGVVTGVLTQLVFTSANGVFVNGTGALTSDATSLSASFTWRIPGGQGTASGRLGGDPASSGTMGTPLADILVGGAGRDTIEGKGDNDTIDGGGGIDTAVFSGSRAQYTITKTGAGYRVSGPDGTDTLTNVERLEIGSSKVALDFGANGAAEKTVRIIGAAFGPGTIAAQRDYVGIGLNLFDAGLSMAAVCQMVVNVLAYSNSQFVTTVFGNVMGRLPTDSELRQYVGLLESGTTQAALLEVAAGLEATAQRINLMGLQQTGVDYL